MTKLKLNGIADLTINTDSLYVINVMTNLGTYKRNGWKNSANKQVLNRDILKGIVCSL